MYDSKFGGGDLDTSLTHQLALVYRPLITVEEDGEEVDPHLVVRIPPVQQQKGSSDCGVYAIAFAVHAALGDDIKDLEFDQAQMRNHLLKCFRKKELVRFPTTRKRSRHNNHFPYCEIQVFCSCQMPESYGDMIQCDKCERWYHIIRCVGLSSIPQDTELWHCHSCC